MYKKLFIPGPTHVRDEILQAQAIPMIGHRAKEYSDLQAAVTPKLQQMLHTKQRVYLFASSSTGVMEGSVRQASLKKVLSTVTQLLWSVLAFTLSICGAFFSSLSSICSPILTTSDSAYAILGAAVITPAARRNAASGLFHLRIPFEHFISSFSLFIRLIFLFFAI